MFESQIEAWVSTPVLSVFLLYYVRAGLSYAEPYHKYKRD